MLVRMCGRYGLITPLEALRRLFAFEGGANLRPRWNIAPTQTAPVVRPGPGSGERELVELRWGLVPAWARDLSFGAQTIMARAETVAEKPAFRAAFRQRRCLVLTDGFYEWQGEGRRKQPYRIAFADGRPFAFAGLWERWNDPAGHALETFALVTTVASATLSAVHERMPVMLTAPAEHARWLDPRQPCDDLFGPREQAGLGFFAVDLRVNDVRNDDAACAAPRAGPPPAAPAGPVQPSLF